MHFDDSQHSFLYAQDSYADDEEMPDACPATATMSESPSTTSTATATATSDDCSATASKPVSENVESETGNLLKLTEPLSAVQSGNTIADQSDNTVAEQSDNTVQSALTQSADMLPPNPTDAPDTITNVNAHAIPNS